MVLSMMNGFIKKSWKMELRSYWSSIRTLMGYSDAFVSVYVDVLGPLYVRPGPIVDGTHFYRVWDVQAKGMPWHLARPPISHVSYSLGMPWCSTRPPRVRVLVSVFGWYCCIDWWVTSLVRGSVRVTMAVCCAVQHAIPHSTSQHPCELQYNTIQV